MNANAQASPGLDVSAYLEDIRTEAPPRRPIDFVRLGSHTGYWHFQETPGTGASAARSGKCWANVSHGSMTYRLPRGIPWTQFPIVAPARLMCANTVWHEDMVDVLDEADGNVDLTHYRVSRMEALAQARGMVVDATRDSTSAYRTHHAAFERQLAIAYGVLVAESLAPQVETFGIEEGGRTIPWLSRPEVSEGVRGAMALYRHAYSYQVNARAILAKALAYALSGLLDSDLSRSRSSLMGVRKGTGFTGDGCAAECRRHVAEGRLHGIDTSISLQALHRIRRMGRVPHGPIGDGHMAMEHEYRPVYALQGLFQESQVGAMGWVGSGKHPVWWSRNTQLHRYATGLAWLGLIETDGKAVSLTDAGKRYLDAVHPDSEDPDVLCRWIVPVIENRDVEAAVDAWNMRVFRKCKTRVNALP